MFRDIIVHASLAYRNVVFVINVLKTVCLIQFVNFFFSGYFKYYLTNDKKISI